MKNQILQAARENKINLLTCYPILETRQSGKCIVLHLKKDEPRLYPTIAYSYRYCKLTAGSRHGEQERQHHQNSGTSANLDFYICVQK
jgi:hypothetical protein